MSDEVHGTGGAGEAESTGWRWDDGTYGEHIAGDYDGWYAAVDDAMIEALAELAGLGPVLELGIGTGRVALPLAARGVEVHGIDASAPMLEKLVAKPGGAGIPVTVGSFADDEVEPHAFASIFVVFNTFFSLTTQEDQLACFRSVARHLLPGGTFVLETFVPDMTRFTRGQNLSTTSIATDHVLLESSLHDRAAQRVRSQHVHLSAGGVRLFPIEIRYVWPAEMDLMARLAGLELRARWSGWRREPFTSSSERQIAVYGRDGA